MTSEEYIEGAVRTNSNRYDTANVDVRTIQGIFGVFVAAGQAMDTIKRALYYGKKLDHDKLEKAVNAVGRALLIHKRTLRPHNKLPGYNVKGTGVDGQIVHAALGLATESAEIIEAVLKGLEGEPFDFANLFEEKSDIEWYQALGIHTAAKVDPESKQNGGTRCWTHEGIWTKNLAKLKARYPDKFTTERALNRDIEKEKAALGFSKA